jgi:transcriptional regulator with XRE-family HTH domain
MTGNELKELRKSLGLSLAQASRQVVVSTRTWVRWESENAKIPESVVRLFKIVNGIEKV